MVGDGLDLLIGDAVDGEFGTDESLDVRLVFGPTVATLPGEAEGEEFLQSFAPNLCL
jgi:hypothetical protein